MFSSSENFMVKPHANASAQPVCLRDKTDASLAGSRKAGPPSEATIPLLRGLSSVAGSVPSELTQPWNWNGAGDWLRSENIRLARAARTPYQTLRWKSRD